MAFPKVKPGDSYAPSAAFHNATIDALAAVAQLRDLGGSAGQGFGPLAWIQCLNTSGTDRDIAEVMGIYEPAITPTDNLNEFRTRPVIKGATPTLATYWGKFGILLEPAPNNRLARLAVAGVVPVKLDVGHASHTHADVTDSDGSKLTTGFFGAAEILWKESGTGAKWGLVRLGPPYVGPVRGVTDAAITKGATTGTVSIYLAGTDTGANLTNVHNPWADVAITKKVAVAAIGAGVTCLMAKEC